MVNNDCNSLASWLALVISIPAYIINSSYQPSSWLALFTSAFRLQYTVHTIHIAFHAAFIFRIEVFRQPR